MELYPTVVADAEVAYRRERIAEDFWRAGARPRRLHRPRQGVADRVRWHRRDDRAA